MPKINLEFLLIIQFIGDNMTTKQLQKIYIGLDETCNQDKILIDKIGYYLYYNEPNKKRKEVKIHIDICGFCAWGSGRGVKLKESGRNGVWIGPFKNPKQAKLFGKNTLMQDNISEHKCVKNTIKLLKK